MTERFHLDGDWFGFGVPGNVELGQGIYIDTSYCFGLFTSKRSAALKVGSNTGIYDRSLFLTGPDGVIEVGSNGCINAATLISSHRVTIGDQVLLGWGSVITDVGGARSASVMARREALQQAAANRELGLPAVSDPKPVTIGDNVWIGFDVVIGPGVTIGTGAVIGAKTCILDDVDPYTVVVGSPQRVIAELDPLDAAVTGEILQSFRATYPDIAVTGDAGGGSWITGHIRRDASTAT